MSTSGASLACFLCLLLAPGLANASGTDDSRELEAAKKAFDAGMDQFRNGDNEGARILFAQSYAAYPAIETLRNLAITELNSDEPLEALGHFKQYASDRSADAEFVRNRLPAYLARCNQRVGHLRLAVARDVTLSVDGRAVPDTKVVIDVSPGEHAVAAQRGSSSNAQTIRVAAGQTLDVPLPPWTAAAPAHGTTDLAATAPLGVDQGDVRARTWWTEGHVVAAGLGGLAVVGVGVGLVSLVAERNSVSSGNADRALLAGGGPCTQC